MNNASNRPELPYLFLVGCPRSGTTLLHRMLDNHPQLAVANETYFIPRCLPRDAADRDPLMTQEILERVLSYRRFPKFGLPDDAVREAAVGAATYTEFVSALYAQFARIQRKRLAGEKAPDYARHLPLLNDLFPQAKIVHIIRDGREVALSLLNWSRNEKGPARFALWQEEPIAACALWWALRVKKGRDDGRKLGPSLYHEVCYDQLVGQPEETLRGLAEFLDLPYAPEMTKYHEGKTRSAPGLSTSSAWLPPTAGLRNWRSDMASSDIELFEALTGELLSELGLDRYAPDVSTETAERAARYQADWAVQWANRKTK